MMDLFLGCLDDFAPSENAPARCLAMYSAAIAVADETALDRAAGLALKHGLTREQLYEVALQSYLFLGFPRMLIAAEALEASIPAGETNSALAPISPEESISWFERGVDLCRRVYGDAYDPLKDRVESLAPEVFRWMIIEGYGKVLSRPGLTPVERELAIVACLIVENREKQLFSHIRGALNVGASVSLLNKVISDLGALDDGHRSALAILSKLGAA